MANKKKIAIAVGIGAVVGIGMTILAGLGLGKKQAVRILESAIVKNKTQSHL